ncbi:MAG: hypothetical protein E7161_02070 [Firmicutes bacterium]|nr:hypothetical protein [Bacillota bacterium]
MTYKDALNNVLEYEESLGLNIPEDTEVGLLRQYLIRDARILSTVLHGLSLAELRSYESYPTEELIEYHQDYSSAYINLVESNMASYVEELNIARPTFAKAVNFYLLGIYEHYGITEEQALDFISKMTGISKEELIRFKSQIDFNLSKEISTGISPFLKRVRQKNDSDKK